jgi:hypothetical protein
LVLLGLSGLLVAGAACGGGSDSPSAAQAVAEAKIVTTTTTVPPTTTTTMKVAASFDDLARSLVTTVPAGYKVQPNDVGDTGPSNLEKAVDDDGEPDARAVLTRDGFVRGYQRLWNKTDDEQIIAFLYQFGDHAGAVDYAQRTNDGMRKPEDGVTVTPFDVPGIDGAVGMVGGDPTFSSSVVVYPKGPYVVQLVVMGPTPVGQTDIVKGLATEQFARL